MKTLWEWDLRTWRNRIARERGGPVKWRIQAIEELDQAIAYLTRMQRAGLLQDEVSGWKN